ncbi:MAG TPA: hypothetical protein VF989_11940 [Polyangiaceae bacterium]
MSLHVLAALGVAWVAGAAIPARTRAPLLGSGETWEIEAIRVTGTPPGAVARELGRRAPPRNPTESAEPSPDVAPAVETEEVAPQRTTPSASAGAELSPPAPTGQTESLQSTSASAPAADTTGVASALAGAGAIPVTASATTLGGEQETPDPRRRSLVKEFTRMLPRAGHADPFWSSRPLGFFDSARVRLELDDEGRLESVVGEPVEIAAHWKRLVERTRLFLKIGRFSSETPDSAKAQVLMLTAHVSDRPSLREESYDPSDSVELSSEPPTPGRPGKARFSYPSGRQVEITVELIP